MKTILAIVKWRKTHISIDFSLILSINTKLKYQQRLDIKRNFFFTQTCSFDVEINLLGKVNQIFIDLNLEKAWKGLKVQKHVAVFFNVKKLWIESKSFFNTLFLANFKIRKEKMFWW